MKTKTPPSQIIEREFNPTFYRNTYNLRKLTDAQLIQHYLREGAVKDYDPNPWFSTAHYRRDNPDVLKKGVNPFVHFLLHGKKEGRLPRPGLKGPARIVLDTEADMTPASVPKVLVRRPESAAVPPERPRTKQDLSIHWVIPDFTEGSGGHMTILRMVRFMEMWGHHCTIWILRPRFHPSPENAYETILRSFQTVRAEVRFLSDAFFDACANVVFATSWETAFYVDQAKGFNEKFYLVQDMEDCFSPVGSESLLAKQSYQLGLNCITAGPWLKETLELQYDAWARHFNLAADEVYLSVPREKKEINEVPVIAFYSRVGTARRCVDLGLAALQILSDRGFDFEVAFFGEQLPPLNRAPFVARNLGILDKEGLAELYGRADLGLCFSGTNYSLVPQEMMACDLPVLELDGENTRSVFPEGVVAFAGPLPESIADKIQEVLTRTLLRQQQVASARQWCRKFSWEQSARQVLDAVWEKLEVESDAPTRVEVSESPRVDIVIPTYNGIETIPRVVQQIRNQRTRIAHRIICVDSSSTDGTNEWLAEQEDVHLKTIPKDEFQHGGTRNLGASLGEGEFLVFLTQDAIPADGEWLHNLISVFEHYGDAAGAFGGHLAHADHSPFIHHEIKSHFELFAQHPLCVSKYTDEAKWKQGELGWRKFLHFFSNNNSCLRRRVWQQFPLPFIEYGEDQVWADTIIKAGFSKVFVPTARVYHSHDYRGTELFERAKTEAEFFASRFGYEIGPRDLKELKVAAEAMRIRVTELGLKLGVSEDEIREQKLAGMFRLRGQMEGLRSAYGEEPEVELPRGFQIGGAAREGDVPTPLTQ